ncbi:MAG: HD domain-containing phosphohydrolase [Candidatus Margulisiibacteriota bacterium]|jgi:putative nucleotidyltransferase with HDIG domain
MDNNSNPKIEKLLNTLKEKAEDTYQHSLRIKELVENFLENLKLEQKEKDQIIIAALLHDIGMINISGDILLKDHRLSFEEYDLIKEHSVLGEQIAKDLELDKEIQSIIRHHHENYNGFGYPDSIEKNEIPLGSKIILIAETYDTIIHKRNYQKVELGKEFAIKELKEYANRIYDKDLVDKFITFIEKTA